MTSTHKHLRSSTANKRPTTSIAEGQIALNTNTTSPGLFFKDSTGATIIKVGPVHVGTTAPNATPPAGGSSGNSIGEVWLDTSLTPNGVKIWNGSAWVNATPVGSTTVQGLLELATDAETQAGSDTARAVTPASLQSKMSDSATTTSATTIASSTAVKTAYDLANAALPRSGGTITGNLEIGTTGSLSFEGSVADGFETTIAVTNPTADRTITLPDQTGNVLVSGNASIVNADVSASAAIAGTKISPDFGAQNVITTGTSTAASFNPTSSTVPTNGVYLPAANSVGISTNGSGRLFVDSSGRLGIGTSAPGQLLEVNGNIQGGNFLAPNAATYGVASNTRIGIVPTAATNERIEFYVGASERLRITSTGLVGIGTSAPGVALDVNGISRSLGVSISGSSRTGGTAAFDPGTISSDLNWGMHFRANTSPGVAEFAWVNGAGSERMRLDSSGRLGIGTSAPSYLLQAAGTIASVNPFGNFAALQTAGGTGFRWTLNNDGTFRLQRTLDAFANASVPILIDSSDRVGIGTLAPSVTFHCAGDVRIGANDNSNAYLEIGAGATGNRFALIDLVGDTTYSDYGLRIIRGNTGANAESAFVHRGTGALSFNGVDSAPITFVHNIVERARIDSSGRLLVGTSTAAQLNNFTNDIPLQISRGAAACGIQLGSFRADQFGADLIFAKSRSATNGTNTVVNANDGLGAINWYGADGTNYIHAARIECQIDATPGTNDMPGRIVLATTADGASSPTERLRVDNAGGTSIISTNFVLDISTTLGAGSTNLINGRYSGTAGTIGSGTLSFAVVSNGNVLNTNNSYGALSDVKLKENIVDATSQWSDIKALQVRKYNFKEGQTHTQIGLIAQEVELVSPGLVSESPDRDGKGNDLGTVTKSVNYSVLYMKAVKALQEAMERIETLEAKVAALEGA